MKIVLSKELEQSMGLLKLASEMLIEEFGYAYNIKYIINRCSVISGPMQFGKQDQGFVSHWIWKHINKSKLSILVMVGTGTRPETFFMLKIMLFINTSN